MRSCFKTLDLHLLKSIHLWLQIIWHVALAQGTAFCIRNYKQHQGFNQVPLSILTLTICPVANQLPYTIPIHTVTTFINSAIYKAWSKGFNKQGYLKHTCLQITQIMLEHLHNWDNKNSFFFMIS